MCSKKLCYRQNKMSKRVLLRSIRLHFNNDKVNECINLFQIGLLKHL